MQSVTMLELQRDHYPKAQLTIGDASPIHGVDAWYDGTTVRAQDRNGLDLGSLEVAPDPSDGKRKVQRLDGKTFRFTAADGTYWEIYRGCGCGGG